MLTIICSEIYLSIIFSVGNAETVRNFDSSLIDGSCKENYFNEKPGVESIGHNLDQN